MSVRNLNLTLHIYAKYEFDRSSGMHEQYTAFTNHEARAVGFSWAHIRSIWWRRHYYARAICLLLPLRGLYAKIRQAQLT